MDFPVARPVLDGLLPLNCRGRRGMLLEIDELLDAITFRNVPAKGSEKLFVKCAVSVLIESNHGG